MLEICLPVSGLGSISLIGVLSALRERRIVPDIITGVSGGAWAAMAVLGKCYQDGHAVHFTKMVRDHLISRPISRFFPPYHRSGIPKELLRYSMAHSSDPATIKKLGVKHFYVGHTKLPSFKFVTEDVLKFDSREKIFHAIWRSSSLPFLTHHGIHSHWGLDGGLRRLVFPSDHEVKERWIISNYVKPFRFTKDRKKFHRIIPVPTKIRLPLFATDKAIEASFSLGYEEGMRLKV